MKRGSPPRRRPPRRALTNLKGAIKGEGEPGWRARLSKALETAANETELELTHPFHTYPAKMHPAIARVVLEAFGSKPLQVLDPFCGSGTVLLEARIRNHVGIGVDLNPLALQLTEVKCARRTAADRTRFLSRLHQVGAASLERVRNRVASRAPLAKQDLRWYPPHVLKELAGLLAEIRRVDEIDDRRALELVFSTTLVKFSLRRADTSRASQTKTIRKGLPTEFFVRKGEELAGQWEELERALPVDSQPPRLFEGDARRLSDHLPPESIDLVLTSPPYGGTYDYLEHHRLRLSWLGGNTKALASREIGARRRLRDEQDAPRWDREMRSVLAAMRAVLRPGGHVCLVLGDAQLGEMRIDALQQLKRLAPQVGLKYLASASATRRDWLTRKDPRHEHVVVLSAREN